MWIKPRRFNTLHYGSLGHYERQHRASPDGGWADFEVFRYSGKNLRPLFVLVYDRHFVLAQSDDCDALLAAEWKYATEKLPLLAAGVQPPLTTSKQREKWLCKRVAAIAQSVLAVVKGRAPPPLPAVPVSPAAASSAAAAAGASAADDDEWEFTDDDEGTVTIASVSADPALAAASPVLTAPPSPVPPLPPTATATAAAATAAPTASTTAVGGGGRERSRSNSSPVLFVAPPAGAPASGTAAEAPLLPGDAPEQSLSASGSPSAGRHHSERRPAVRVSAGAAGGTAAGAAAACAPASPCEEASEIFFSPPSASSGSMTHTASGLIHRMTKRKSSNNGSGSGGAGTASAAATPVPARRGCTPTAGVPASDDAAPEGTQPVLVRSVTPASAAVSASAPAAPTTAAATEDGAGAGEEETGVAARVAAAWLRFYAWLRGMPLFVTYVEPWVEAFQEECPTSKQRTRRYIVVGCSVLTGVLLLAYASNSVMLCLELLVLNAALVEAIRNRAAVIRYLCRTKVSHSTTRSKKRFLRSWHKPHLRKKDAAAAPAPAPAPAPVAPTTTTTTTKAGGAAPPVAEEPSESSDEDELLASLLSESDD